MFKKLFKRKEKKLVKASHQIKRISKVFVTLTRLEKLHFYFALLPSNFNLAEHINNYPPKECGFDSKYNFDKEKVKFLLGSLSTVIAENKDLIVDDGYVPLNSTFLNAFITDYNHYLWYLINTGVIECNETYRASTPQQKGYSKGYKWTEQYANSTFQRVWMDKTLDKKGNLNIKPAIHREKLQVLTAGMEAEPTYPYLDCWYEQRKLHLDIDAALKYAELIRDKKLKLGEESWDYNKDKDVKKHPNEQYKAILNNLYSLEINDYKVHIDDNVHRLHSVLTNMQKDFRNFINYDNEQLVSIDISNSQPYLLCLFFRQEFWQSKTSINITTLPHNIQSRIDPSLIIMLGNNVAEIHDNKSVAEYMQKASGGIIYEHIMDLAKEKLGKSLTRKEAKLMMLIVFFSKNGFFHQKGAELKKMFAQLYPEIYEIIASLKEEDHTSFACLLQAIESEMILHKCCRRISEETGFKVPVFTIHDSIVTTVGNEQYVGQVMFEELSSCIGIKPHLKFEYWSEKELDQELYALIRGKAAIQEM